MTDRDSLKLAIPAGDTELIEAQPETIQKTIGVDMIYGLHAKPPLQETLAAALQHVLAAFVNIIAPAIVVGGYRLRVCRYQFFD